MADNFAFLLQVLTQTGCQCHAVRLTALGITSLQALSDRASEAASQEVDAEDIAKVLTAARLLARRRLTGQTFRCAGATPVRPLTPH